MISIKNRSGLSQRYCTLNYHSYDSLEIEKYELLPFLEVSSQGLIYSKRILDLKDIPLATSKLGSQSNFRGLK